MAIVSPNPDLVDLKITVQESGLVFPSQKTERRSFFLSNIDCFLNFTIGTVHFFHRNPQFPPENVAPRLKTALGKVLVPYDFMAGRLARNHRLWRYEIDCNSAGAGFVVASSHYSLQGMGDLAAPNLGFRQLVPQSLNNADQPLCVFQVTSFKCGGFAVGMSYNHMLLDGISAKVFEENLASQAFEGDKPLAVIPLHNRRLLAARAPPRATFPQPEFVKLHNPFDIVTVQQQLDVIVLKLSSADINFLKVMAKTTANETSITTFNVVAALIWKCRALALHDIEQDMGRAVTLLCAVDIRSRLVPALPREYCGNALLTAHSSARSGDLRKAGFSEVVEMVSRGQERMSDEYVRSKIDWLEMNKAIPRGGDIILSSWLKLGFDEVVFPWGKPTYSGPVMNPMERLCWVFPVDDDDGVGVLIQRPSNEMERFRSHLLYFFRRNQY